jgi:phage tail sheath protein FI
LPAGVDPFGAAFSTAFGANGSDGAAISSTEVVGVPAPPRPNALEMLDQTDLFNLLCIPPPDRETDWTSAVWNPAAGYCGRRRAVLLVDSPAVWDEAADVVAGLGALMTRSNAAALYFPRVQAPDPLKEFAIENFAPCGMVAGVLARTDAVRGVWKAPAGLDARMTGVTALSLGGLPGMLTDGQVGILNPLGVNCLRTVVGTGHVVWGARTLDGADFLGSEWKYLPVRRLAFFIEETLLRATQWAVFEPNDEQLWSQLRLNIGAFMQTLFRRGAFQGTSPNDAYFVKCSHETTTQDDIDRGVVNVVVGFAPLKPAEFVIITIQQILQQQA